MSLGDTVQTVTGKADPARNFKCNTAARGVVIGFSKRLEMVNSLFKKYVSPICNGTL